MARLKIDHRDIEVPAGTKVIEAAEKLGIMIPRFCFHPALGSLGACRMCAVKFVEGPVKGVEMSCMIEAEDGMVVSTIAPEAVEFRRSVIEWLMLNHPHDCPVCDEGGHCLLQDETVSGGHGLRRYLGLKRTYLDQYLGEFVQHEMNRCIHCWRCRRFYQDFAGYRDFGAMQLGSKMYFGRFRDGPLESPFAGNIIDLCPTGVLTDKPGRYRGRRWDFERAPSLCLHCSLGCNTIGNARYREVVRQEARFHDAVNGYFICDRGRYGFDYTNHPGRPRRARLGTKAVPVGEALQEAAHRLHRISRDHGAGAVAVWGSPRSSLETHGFLLRLCRQQGWLGPQFFLDPALERKVKAAISRLDTGIAVSLRDMEKSDFVMVAGVDPVHEAPMLALALRQAYRQGGTVVVIDPRPVSLPFEFEHLPFPPGGIDLGLNLISRAAFGHQAAAGRLESLAGNFHRLLTGDYQADAIPQDRLAALGRKLRDCQNPVMVCNTDIVRETTPMLAADHARLWQAAKGRAGLFYLLPGPNAFGAARLSAKTAADPLEALESGSVKALLVVESDPFWSYPDRLRLTRALDKLELLVALDYLPSATVARAQVFLPTATVFEKEASHYLNQQGRLQEAMPLHQGGAPIAQVSGGSHPPREFLNFIPGGEPRPAPAILADLAETMPGAEAGLPPGGLWSWLSRENEGFSPLAGLTQAAATSEVSLLPESSRVAVFSPQVVANPEEVPPGQVELLLVDQTFGTEELAGYSAPIRKVEEEPCLTLHHGLAAGLGFASGDRVVLSLPGGEVTVRLKTGHRMAPGVAILPRHRRLEWQKVSGGPVWLPTESIKKL